MKKIKLFSPLEIVADYDKNVKNKKVLFDEIKEHYKWYVGDENYSLMVDGENFLKYKEKGLLIFCNNDTEVKKVFTSKIKSMFIDFEILNKNGLADVYTVSNIELNEDMTNKEIELLKKEVNEIMKHIGSSFTCYGMYLPYENENVRIDIDLWLIEDWFIKSEDEILKEGYTYANLSGIKKVEEITENFEIGM